MDLVKKNEWVLFFEDMGGGLSRRLLGQRRRGGAKRALGREREETRRLRSCLSLTHARVRHLVYKWSVCVFGWFVWCFLVGGAWEEEKNKRPPRALEREESREGERGVAAPRPLSSPLARRLLRRGQKGPDRAAPPQPQELCALACVCVCGVQKKGAREAGRGKDETSPPPRPRARQKKPKPALLSTTKIHHLLTPPRDPPRPSSPAPSPSATPPCTGRYQRWR